ncbi:hypothetical protein VP1G_09562 [Cytospora mali]|uniref:protein disulfide-isomerase n=1 Tax=Cytospora mali TaxID=578113 RepID=A0A194VEI7_CYTMA|nr:hypothetical protein VP1G_09562 [Valsa mali var. pyri (nom. inval.)]
MHHPTLTTVATALLAALPAVNAAGLYTKSSPVIQLDAKDYDSLIAKSNQTSIVEFYAPWCGHCQNLKPAYEKAAKNLEGLAKVAAVNCDDDANKPFCGTMGVQGFPTLKIIRPGAKKGRPVVEDYQGQRSAKAIVEAVVDKIPNHVKRVTDKDVDEFLATKNESAKAILFTEKGTTSAMLKSIAIDFLDVITVGQVRNTQKKAVGLFGIEKFPALVLLPGGDKDGIVYDGELKKDALVQFLSQAGSPNPDPAPKKSKTRSSTPKKPATDSATEPSAEAEEKVTEPLGEPEIQKPVIFEGPLPIPIINSAEKLVSNCLAPKSHTCVLAFVPKESRGEAAEKALAALAELAHKHAQSKRHLFPMYEVHIEDEHSKDILNALELKGDVQVLAINARRGWWRLYEAEDFGHESIESWIDQIRMSEGVKRKLPDGVVATAFEETQTAASEAAPEASSEPTAEATESETAGGSATPEPEITPDAEEISDSVTDESTSWKGADPTVQEETAEPTGATHDEL